MGREDVITKEYMEDTEVFADVFNHMIYKGEKVIDPKNLKELDTAKSLVLVAVSVMEEMTGMKIERKEEEETVNVCKGLRDLQEKGRVEGIQIGAEHEQRLTKALLNDNRIDDLKRALEDPAFRQKLLEEYGID